MGCPALAQAGCTENVYDAHVPLYIEMSRCASIQEGTWRDRAASQALAVASSCSSPCLSLVEAPDEALLDSASDLKAGHDYHVTHSVQGVVISLL